MVPTKGDVAPPYIAISSASHLGKVIMWILHGFLSLGSIASAPGAAGRNVQHVLGKERGGRKGRTG